MTHLVNEHTRSTENREFDDAVLLEKRPTSGGDAVRDAEIVESYCQSHQVVVVACEDRQTAVRTSTRGNGIIESVFG